jgi:E3 ubiquitin-protein ligase SHPRH
METYSQPISFADYDIVVTSYEILSKELHYVGVSNERQFRNARRYVTLPSPLTCVEWWRICLDEAQMVEQSTTNQAQMALKLSTVHGWLVTSTPVQNSLNGTHVKIKVILRKCLFIILIWLFTWILVFVLTEFAHVLM